MSKTLVYMGWGESPERGDTTERFEFNSEEEARAFVLGVRHGQGWYDYAVFRTPHVYENEWKEAL